MSGRSAREVIAGTGSKGPVSGVISAAVDTCMLESAIDVTFRLLSVMVHPDTTGPMKC